MTEGEREAREITDQAEKRVEAERERLRARARQRAAEERNRIVTLARLAARRELLTEKQRLIDRVFEEAGKSVLGMGREEYQDLMRTFLVDVAGPGDAEVIIDENETRIDQAFLDRVANDLGRAGSLRLSSERRRIGGGFILRSGRTEVNCALDTILREARERLETEVARVLFGAGEKA